MSDKPSEDRPEPNIQDIVDRIRDRFAEIEKIITEMQSHLKKEN